MIDYDIVKQWRFEEIVQNYTARDTMLYALGIGMGADPLDEAELAYVYEKSLQAVPTMATVLGSPGLWLRDPRTGADYVKLVHGEQSIRLLRPLPPAATVVASNRVLSITDKGAAKGAIVVVQRELKEQGSGALLADIRQVTFLRGDGGFSAGHGRSDPGPEPLPAVPERAPDREEVMPTLERQALIYRLSGDYNPLHSDPGVARSAGFSRPILHGLCTYGIAAHALLKSVCGHQASRLKELSVRFTAPVYPGETVRVQLWREETGRVRLRARVDARDATVLNNGVAVIG